MNLLLIVKSHSPIALSASRANAQFAQGLDYIPGSTLRGALAALYLQKVPGQKPDETFQALFLDQKVSYPDLLPTYKGAFSSLFPATAYACKRYKLKHPESIGDELLSLTVQADQRRTWEQTLDTVPETLVAGKYCLQCQGQNPLHQLSGYYLMIPAVDFKIQPVKVHQRLIAGTSINRTTGTAQSGMLFSRDVLEEDQYFGGYIRLPDDLPETQVARLKELIQPGAVLRVGYGRSRGLGKLEVVSPEDDLDAGPDLAERWQKFNVQAQDMGLPTERAYFSLTLESDWIRATPGFYLPTALPDTKELDIPNLRCEHWVLRTTTVMGWNALLNLPKESQPALKRGSVFLFSVPADPESVTATQKRLHSIGVEGLGERRNEGFGRVRVCDPFHYEKSITVEDTL